jgi:hypothetical protein
VATRGLAHERVDGSQIPGKLAHPTLTVAMDDVRRRRRQPELARRQPDMALDERPERKRTSKHHAGGGEARVGGIDVAQVHSPFVGDRGLRHERVVAIVERDARAPLGKRERDAAALQTAAEHSDVATRVGTHHGTTMVKGTRRGSKAVAGVDHSTARSGASSGPSSHRGPAGGGASASEASGSVGDCLRHGGYVGKDRHHFRGTAHATWPTGAWWSASR